MDFFSQPQALVFLQKAVPITADIVFQIAEQVIAGDSAARDLHALFSLNHALRVEGIVHDSLWQRAHDRQFGPLPRELARLPEKSGFTWRNLVVTRLAIIATRKCRVGRELLEKYRISQDIRYTLPRLHQEIAFAGDNTWSMVETIHLVKPVLRSYLCTPYGSTLVRLDLFGYRGVHNYDDIDKFYINLALRGAFVPPFASSGWPRFVFSITQVPLCPVDAAVSRLGERDTIECAYEHVLCPLAKLILATAHVTPHDPHYNSLVFFNAFLCSNPEERVTKGVPKEIRGEEKLLEALEQTRKDVRMVFSPAHADHHQSPLYWAKRLPSHDPACMIGYAFSGDTLPAGYDTTTFGRGHADHIISITLGGLRLYDQWIGQQTWDEKESPGLQVLLGEAGLGDVDARSLHEILVRLSLPAPYGRAPGTAIPAFV